MINIFSIQVVLILLVLFCHVTSTVYYVIPTTGNQSCPTDQECHTLSHYINNITLPFNVTLLFMNGEHLLKANEVLQIKGLNNVKLLGQGQWVQGFYQSIIQSNVIIKCIYKTSTAINVSASTIIHINGLTITHCSRGIVIHSVLDAKLNKLSVRHGSKFGLWINNTDTVTIDSCSFSHNGVNAFLNLVKNVSINYSNFTNGQRSMHGFHVTGGFSIHNIDHLPSTGITILIFGCIVHSNVGGVFLYSNNVRHHTVIIQSTVFHDNSGLIEGLFVEISAVHSEIIISGVTFLHNVGRRPRGAILDIQTRFNNTVIIKNTTFIGNNNGGLTLRLTGKSVLHTLIKNSNFLNNFGTNGQVGGLFIYMFGDGFSYDRSLHILNTTFDSNTGVAVYINTNANVKITDVDVVKTVKNTGPQLIHYIGALQLICTDDKQTVTLSNVHINNNHMTGLWLKTCQVDFVHKSSIISNNKSPGNGGGIYVDDNAALYSSVPVYLTNNKATQYGGAIYSTANLVATSINRLSMYKRKCSYYKFDVQFLDNNARFAGNDIYGGYFLQFHPFHSFRPYFNDVVDCKFFLRHSLRHCLPKTQSSISSAPLGACICINN